MWVRISFGCTQLCDCQKYSHPGLRRSQPLAGKHSYPGGSTQWQTCLSFQIVAGHLHPACSISEGTIQAQDPQEGREGRTGCSPSPVQLQCMTVTLMSDLVFGQTTVAVQFYVILIPSHFWFWVSWEESRLGCRKVSSKTVGGGKRRPGLPQST